jgi:hypothetical protein
MVDPTRARDHQLTSQSLMGLIWGPLCSVRSRMHEIGSTKLPGTHLGLSRPGSGQEARICFHRGSWDSSGALQAGFGLRGPNLAPQRLLGFIWCSQAGLEPGGPNLSPQRLLGLFWGPPGLVRARRPESVSTEAPETHLGPPRPGSSREARICLHRASCDHLWPSRLGPSQESRN